MNKKVLDMGAFKITIDEGYFIQADAPKELAGISVTVRAKRGFKVRRDDGSLRRASHLVVKPEEVE